MRRRDLLTGALGCAGCGLLALAPRRARGQDQAGGRVPAIDMNDNQGFVPVEARHFQRLAEKRIECRLCPRRCRVADLERGTCGVRENHGGTYYTLVHSRAVSANVDPIEKKPFFHVLPGTTAFSIATAGCNMECKFCQNWQISQYRPEQVEAMHLPPAAVHEAARRAGARTIAYTYTEPTVYWEYMFDTAVLGRTTGVRSVVVSAGYIEEKPLRELLPHVEAVKIDLKSFRQGFYDRLCRGRLADVLRTLELVREAGRWLEIVVLVVPTMNDSEAEIRDLARWVKRTLGPDVPLHFTRFHPTYRLRNLPRTPIETMERCQQIAVAEGLHFAYIGNAAGHPGENTICPGCRELLVRRAGMATEANRLDGGRCPKCRRTIPGIWS